MRSPVAVAHRQLKLPVRQRRSAFPRLSRGTVAPGRAGPWLGKPARPGIPSNSSPAAAKVLGALLEKLRSASAQGRPGGLALVRTITEKGGD